MTAKAVRRAGKRIGKVIGVLMCASLLSGCGTFAAHPIRNQGEGAAVLRLPPVYAAASWDVVAICWTCTGRSYFQSEGGGLNSAQKAGIALVELPIYMADIPISVVTDTCRLPCDI